MITLLPPQKLVINDVKEKRVTWNEEEPLTFIYVGSDFIVRAVGKRFRRCLNCIKDIRSN